MDHPQNEPASRDIPADDRGIAAPVWHLVTGDGWEWCHLDRSHEGAGAWLAARGVPEQAIEALLDTAVRPRLTRASGGLVLILRAEPSPVSEKIARRLVSLRCWVDARGLVSLSRETLPAIEALAAAPPPAFGTLLADLVERVVDGVTPRVEALSVDVEALEDRILLASSAAPPDQGAADRLAALRRRLVKLERKLGAQRDALAALSRLSERDAGLPGRFVLDAAARLDLDESVEQCRHDAEEAEQARERALILRDELERRADERTARHGFALSVAAAVFLPATFITGLLGINVGGIPGAEDPRAFWVVVGLCAGVAGASVGFVLWRRWL